MLHQSSLWMKSTELDLLEWNLDLQHEGATALGLPVAMSAYVYTLIFVTVPSLASVYNEYALKSQYDTSIYLQVIQIEYGPSSFDIFEGHSKATMLLIFNNAAQGILSSFFFKYEDTILKKYSSTVATIFTGIASAALFGHSDYKLYVRNYSCFHLNAPGLPCVSFSPPLQFFSPLSKVKDEQQNGVVELKDVQDNHRYLLLVLSVIIQNAFISRTCLEMYVELGD
ncbi:hypothetical protein HYC85_013346 [Camellia sinensis]|uniref:Uncharacterized protein n=1 Tax=Camellia sinensis TaxID=4442 RepID=A0A7J7H354_CAMSI|nr:hypothetical protein HYC85_013346 [Camellia sinensis]